MFYGFFHMGCEWFLLNLLLYIGEQGFGCVLFSVTAPPQIGFPTPAHRKPPETRGQMRQTGLCSPGHCRSGPGGCIPPPGLQLVQAAQASGIRPMLSGVPQHSLLGPSGLGSWLPCCKPQALRGSLLDSSDSLKTPVLQAPRPLHPHLPDRAPHIFRGPPPSRSYTASVGLPGGQ